MIAYCFASGQIDFGQIAPSGTLPIASGPAKVLREKIAVVARHAYDGVTLLVPGIPEAQNEKAGVEALMKFKEWIKPGFERAGLTV